MNERILTFGKYKGQPVEVLATDHQYMNWLINQTWFREKYINFYNVLINNFREPEDTPEHNKIQIKFLKKDYQIRLAYLANPNLFNTSSVQINQLIKNKLEKEDYEAKCLLEALRNPNADSGIGFYDRRMIRFSKPTFEKGIDVLFSIWYGKCIWYHAPNHNNSSRCCGIQIESSYSIEIKPVIGDDFPSVLRQMKASMPIKQIHGDFSDKHYILLVGEYNGIGATTEEFVDFFKTQGYKVVFVKDLEQVILPEFDHELKLDKEIEEKISSLKFLR